MAKQKTNIQKYVLFVGGHNGAVDEIIRICGKEGIKVIDRHLTFTEHMLGTSIDPYEGDFFRELHEGRIPILVNFFFEREEEPQEPPMGSILINPDKGSMLMQFLNLIGKKKPSRHQYLIAENEEGYVPYMIEGMDASEQEIANILEEDRQALGITPEEEEEAKRAIANAEEKYGVTVIRTAAPIRAVIDRVFNYFEPMKVLIITGWRVVFYDDPEDIDALEGHFGVKREDFPCPHWSAFTHTPEEQQAIEDFILDRYAPVQFVNLLPRTLVLEDGTKYEPSGKVATVQFAFGEFDKNHIAKHEPEGKIIDLPDPAPGVRYIVYDSVLYAGSAIGRHDLVTPVTASLECGHNDEEIIVRGFVQ